MTTFSSSDKIWTTYADPKQDVVPMGSYLGEAIFNHLQRRDPERVAEYNHDTEEAITFKDIYERTITVALNLNDLNIGPNDTLVFYSRHNSYISSVVFGCYLNATRWCPLDTMNESLDYFIDYLKPTIFIYDEEFKPAVKKSLERSSYKVTTELIFGNPNAENSVEKTLLKQREIKNFVPKDLSKISSPDELIACIAFTSGSTGLPKATLITHSMLVSQINTSSTMEENVNLLSISGIRWMSQISYMFLPTFFGVTKTFTGKDPSPDIAWDIIHKRKVTYLFVTNSMSIRILNHYVKNPRYDFTSLRVLMIAGEPFCSSIYSRFTKTFPNLRIFQGYGATECGGLIAAAEGVGGLHLVEGFSLKILNEKGENVEHNTAGMICLKRNFPFPGYYKREDANKEAYRDGWYITGDYGIMTQNNQLHVYCRYKDVARCNGKLIVPNQIEEYLNNHHIVNRSVVIAVPGNTPQNQKIAVYVNLVEDVEEYEARSILSNYLKDVIDIDILAKVSIVDQFKTTTCGKTDREVLKREFCSM